jgi:hypothetical protein
MWYVTWSYVNDEEQKAMREIMSSGSDRTVGIVAGALLEDRLTEYLKHNLLVGDEDIWRFFFGIGGALGTFESKARIGYLLGLYSKEGQKDLSYIIKIRNAFAHLPLAKDFNTSPVRELCMNLKGVEKQVLVATGWEEPSPHPSLKNPKHRFMHAINQLMHVFMTRSPLSQSRHMPF